MSTTVVFRRSFIRRAVGAFAVVASFALPSSALAQGRSTLIQQDTVQAFVLNQATFAGDGYQTGTATGLINGTSSVIFHFQVIPIPGADGSFPFSFHNTVVITDIDGDQVTFDNDGQGRFYGLLPSFFIGSGGPLTGTYVVTGGTGKFSSWRVGTTFNYKGIASNPPNGQLGTVYVEVSRPGQNQQ